ncbi:hypothetical protein RND71_030558 [Anisodus tanguticus]|uniref:Uncharacterized protein n=1 Tax=Anisodus tanguticus TaxID=243964 RepID=A0AAE1RFG8_9SOLA|nr:hypothetical protein RND71_030558 [Anisodus tanguticus]
MADSKFYYKLSQITAILVVFLLISKSSCARPLNGDSVFAGVSIVLVTGDNLVHQFPTRSSMSSYEKHLDEDKMKVRTERVNLLLHRLPKGKKPVSGPSERTNSLND